MTHSMPEARILAICALLVLLNAALFVAFVRSCYCDWCESRYAVWMRGDRQLCRSCKNMFDRNVRRVRRKRSVLRRIWRPAA